MRRKKKQKNNDNYYEFSKRRIQLLYICVRGLFGNRFIPFLGMHDKITFENCFTVADAMTYLALSNSRFTSLTKTELNRSI